MIGDINEWGDLTKISDVFLSEYSASDQIEIKKAMKDIEAKNINDLKTK